MTHTHKPLVRPTWTLALCVLAAMVSAVSAGAQDSASAQAQATKIAMIYNFGRFTLWPDSRFSHANDPVVVCIDPSDPLSEPFATIDGKPLGGRSLVVRRTSRFDHACNMAYVSSANANDDYLATLRDHGVLTIGETPGFSRAGAIRLTTIGRQVRFEINQRNAAQAGAQLSSNLMRLAITVR